MNHGDRTDSTILSVGQDYSLINGWIALATQSNVSVPLSASQHLPLHQKNHD